MLEEDDETVDQLDVDVTTLPPEAQHEGAVLEITVGASKLCEAEYLPEVTQSRKESAQERLDRLSTKLYEEQAQYHGLQAVDTRRHLITPTTKNSTAGYSTAFNPNLYKKIEYK